MTVSKRGDECMKSNKFAHFLALLVMLIWGISYLSIKVVVSEVNPTVSAFYRFFIASIILFAVLKKKFPDEKILKEDRIRMAVGGLFGVTLYFFFENYSVFFTSASNVAILISTIPIFTLFSQRIIFKERITMHKAVGALLSVIGIVIIIASKEKISLFSKGTLGDLMALAAALCWVMYNVITSKFKGSYKSITVTTYQAIWGTIFLSPSLLFHHITVPSKSVILNLVFLAIFCSFIAYVMYVYCLQKLGATVITTYINLQPIISLVSARILLKENITIYQIVGSAVIILGVSLVSFGEKFSINKFKQMV